MKTSHRAPLQLLVLTCSALAARAQAQETYVERAAALGLVHRHGSGFDAFGDAQVISDWIQSGMAPGDLDGDGDLDLVAAGGIHPSHVFRNDGGSFTDVTAVAGVESSEFARCPALGDYDRDGDLDLYWSVMQGGAQAEPRGKLWRNAGDARFTDVSAIAGVAGAGRSVHAIWYDLDFDGWLDLYLGEFHVSANRLYRNQCDGSFREVGAAVGLDYAGSTHVNGICDIDGDALPDVFVGNDFVVSYSVDVNPALNLSDAQLQGQADGTWLNVNAGSNYDIKQGIMGIAFGDVDYDGDFDTYRTDVEHSWLGINHGWPASGQPWTYEQNFYGVANASMPWLTSPGNGRAIGWGAAFFNADLDRWLDLYVVNGAVAGLSTTNPYSPSQQRNFLYAGRGPGQLFKFTDKTAAYGLSDLIDDRGLSISDFDQDGDMDLFVSPTVGALRYYENRLPKGNRGFLSVVPQTATSAPGGAGTWLSSIDAAGYPHLRWIGGSGTTASQNENLGHFGLGQELDADLVVRFPSGIELQYADIPKDTRLVVQEPALFAISAPVRPIESLAGLGEDQFQVSVFAHAANGAPLDETAQVQLEVAGLTPLGPVAHQGGNHFSRSFRVAALPGEFRVQATIDGWSPRIQPRLYCRGGLDAERSTVTIEPLCVRAASADACTVIVVPRDSQGLLLGPGAAVSGNLAGVPPSIAVEDRGDGSYALRFPAPLVPGTHAVQIEVDGVALLGEPALEAAGPADPAQTSVTFEPFLIYQVAAPNELKFAVIPRDSEGRRLGPRAEVRVTHAGQIPGSKGSARSAPPAAVGAFAPASATASFAPLLPRPEVSIAALRAGRSDGLFTFLIDRGSTDYEQNLPAGTLHLWVDGVLLETLTFDFAQ